MEIPRPRWERSSPSLTLGGCAVASAFFSYLVRASVSEQCVKAANASGGFAAADIAQKLGVKTRYIARFAGGANGREGHGGGLGRPDEDGADGHGGGAEVAARWPEPGGQARHSGRRVVQG